jgi:hypothetical protein
MKHLAILGISTILAGCGTTLTPQLNALHTQVAAKFKADIQGVKAVGIASNDSALIDCADSVLTDQLPPIEALDNVQVTGVFSAIALANAKHEALKIKPSVAQKCSAEGWLLARLGLLGQAAH